MRTTTIRITYIRLDTTYGEEDYYRFIAKFVSDRNFLLSLSTSIELLCPRTDVGQGKRKNGRVGPNHPSTPRHIKGGIP